MRALKTFLSDLHRYLLWLLVSAVFWGWIFSLVTDAPAEKKLLLCVDRPELQEQALDLELEKELPDGIRMIRAHPIDYYMFDQNELDHADLDIVSASHAEEYSPLFLPLAEAGIKEDGDAVWRLDGTAYGLRIYDAASGEGALSSWIEYVGPGDTNEDYYLFFGANSVHIGDGAARRLAERLLSLP